MKFKIDRIIKNLEALKEEKVDFVTESELLKAAIIKVNTIDIFIGMLKILHEKYREREYNISELVSISKKCSKCGISRQTIYRWIEDGIITPYYHKESSFYDKDKGYRVYYNYKKNAAYINIVELLEALERIRAIEKAGN